MVVMFPRELSHTGKLHNYKIKHGEHNVHWSAHMRALCESPFPTPHADGLTGTILLRLLLISACVLRLRAPSDHTSQ